LVLAVAANGKSASRIFCAIILTLRAKFREAVPTSARLSAVSMPRESTFAERFDVAVG
jgi:hypothetical protein